AATRKPARRARSRAMAGSNQPGHARCKTTAGSSITEPRRHGGTHAAAASTATATTAAAPEAAPASSAPSTAAAAAAAGPRGLLYAELGFASVFLVEDVERGQADVGHFLFAEKDLVTLRCVLGRRVRRRAGVCRRCAARQRQGHAGDAQYRYGLAQTLSLRSLLRLRHSRVLHTR